MEGHNPARNRITHDTLMPPLQMSQEFIIGGDTQYGSPVGIANGFVFVEGDQQLHALDLESGASQWVANLPGFFVSPAIAQDRIFVRAEAGAVGYVLALDIDTGDLLWEFKFPMVGSSYDNVGGHVTSPVVVNGLVLVGASRTLHALQAESGEQQWFFKAKDPLASSVTIAEDSVYVSDLTHIYALSLETGAESWRTEYDAVSVFFAPVVENNDLLIPSYNVIHLLDRNTGEQVWSRLFDGKDMIPAAVTKTRVYVKSTNQLYALNRKTGDIVWTYSVNDFVSLPVIAGDFIYIVTREGGKGQLRALRINDGREVWKVEDARLSNAAPVVTGGRVYVRTIDGRVLVYTS